MFGKKSRQIRELRTQVNELITENQKLSTELNTMYAVKDTNHTLQMGLDAANARLREIQDKSNARTRKCRARAKLANQSKIK
jgi:regulator of replication initiation timing